MSKKDQSAGRSTEAIGGRNLSPRHARFVAEFLVTYSASEAVRRAGYIGRNADVVGAKTLRLPKVAAAIEEAERHRLRELRVTADRVEAELARIAFFDIRDLVHDDGTLRGLSELDANTAAAISGIEVVTIGNKVVGFGEVRKLKIADKVKALELLDKRLKIFTDGTLAVTSGVTFYLPSNGRQDR